MKRIFIFTYLLLTCFLFASHVKLYGDEKNKKSKYPPAVYNEKIVIDGRTEEWGTKGFNFDNSTSLLYCVSNDSLNLYLCIKTAEEPVARRIFTGGLQIWIDAEGKKSKHTGILYPMGMPSQQAIRQMHQPGMPLTEKQHKQEFLLFTRQMSLTGFRDSLNGIRFSIGNNTGIEAAIKIDSAGITNYEVKIPFRAFPSDIMSSKVISVGYEIKGLNQGQERGEHQEGESHGGRAPGGSDFGGERAGSGSGSGNPGGEGYHHRQMEDGGGSGQNDRQAGTSVQSFWYKTTLSLHK